MNKQLLSDNIVQSLLLFAATVWIFMCWPLEPPDCNKMVLWPGCEGNARCNFHKKNLRSVQFIIKSRGCCWSPLVCATSHVQPWTECAL